MSYSIDVNLLLYASNADAPEHLRAREFLEGCASGTEVLCLAWTTLMAYLRISTHPRIFSRPLTHQQAEANVTALLELPQVRVVSELDGFWDVYRAVTDVRPTRGNVVPDAHLAAILKQNDVTVLHTNDIDFRRFDFLEVRNPLE